jgi:Rhodopirellula transposase DDE domain
VNTIAATTTATGLRVHAELDTGAYPTGTRISKAELDALPLGRHDWHGDWNYTLHPAPPAAAGPAAAPPSPPPRTSSPPSTTSASTPPTTASPSQPKPNQRVNN